MAESSGERVTVGKVGLVEAYIWPLPMFEVETWDTGAGLGVSQDGYDMMAGTTHGVRTQGRAKAEKEALRVAGDLWAFVRRVVGQAVGPVRTLGIEGGHWTIEIDPSGSMRVVPIASVPARETPPDVPNAGTWVKAIDLLNALIGIPLDGDNGRPGYKSDAEWALDRARLAGGRLRERAEIGGGLSPAEVCRSLGNSPCPVEGGPSSYPDMRSYALALLRSANQLIADLRKQSNEAERRFGALRDAVSDALADAKRGS